VNGETVRTLLVVTMVSVLVWLFAESRTLRAETLTVPVEISTRAGRGRCSGLDEDAWNGRGRDGAAGPDRVDRRVAVARDRGDRPGDRR
jgi:hypothetical protein